ncbi:MAG: hypothetical protein SFU56_16285 [Capsulimonadales bacterium]|nr:hypothetical protein [Capsulimonadales bacterium]
MVYAQDRAAATDSVPLPVKRTRPKGQLSPPASPRTNSSNTSGAPPTAPSALPVHVSEIPASLRNLAQWIVWEADWYEEGSFGGGRRLRMVPCHPKTGLPVSTVSVSERFDFDTVLTAYTEGRFDGIGFLLTEKDPVVAIRIGDALSGDGLPRLDDARALRLLDGYSERSPDGLGLTILVHGHLPPGGCRRELIELAETETFIPITGWRLPDSRKEIGEQQAALEQYHTELFPAPPKRFVPESVPLPLSDEDVLRTAFDASNGARIRQLYRGDTSIIPGGRNAADLALCSMLGFFTGNDAARLDRLFRGSTLFRPKWDTIVYSNGKTYGELTVAKALEGCLVFHSYPVHPPFAVAAPSPEPLSDRPQKSRRKPEERSAEPECAPETFPYSASVSGPLPGISPGIPTVSTASPMMLPVGISENVNPIVFAEQMGRAEGLAQREAVLNAREAAHLLKISPKLLRRTVKPWRRFGGSPAGDRWLLSDLLSKINSAA